MGVYFIVVTSSLAQEYFLKKIDFMSSSITPKQVLYHNDRLFSSIGHFCGNLECCTIFEIDTNGDTLWIKTLPDMDIAGESMLISNDTITLTGNNDPTNTYFRMAHYNLNGDQLGETMEIRKPGQAYTDCYQLTTQRIHDKYFIMGNCTDQDTMYALLYVVDAAGSLDTLIEMASSEVNAIPWDSDIDQDGNLVTFITYDGGLDDKHKLMITYDSKSLDTISSIRTASSYEHLSGIFGAVLEDGRIIHTRYTPKANHQLYSLVCLFKNGIEAWEYNPIKASTSQRAYRVKVLSNGDILGMGICSDNSWEPNARNVPYIFRMNPDGEMLWERVFYEYDPSREKSRYGLVRDVVELPNGDLYGVGMLRYDFATSMVFKVSADGCLDPDDCGTIQFLTEVKNPIKKKDITVYPNPVTDILKIQSHTIRDLDYMLIDYLGRTVIKPTSIDSRTELNMQDLSAGIYYILFIEDQEMVGQRKIIKQ